MRFDQKIMDYVMGDITLTRLNNCRKAIEKQAESFGDGFTVYQVITLKAMLKTLKSRIVKDNSFNEPLRQTLLDRFDFLFDDIMSFSVTK